MDSHYTLMKRDMELIRLLLLKYGSDADQPELAKYSRREGSLQSHADERSRPYPSTLY
jgi:hypothetical protein